MPDVKTALATTLIEGQLVDATNAEVESRVNEEASAEIPFGRMVKEGTADKENGALLMAAQADIPAGIVVHSHRYSKDAELGSTGLKPNVTMSILRRGVIAVKVTEAVTTASPVKYNEAGGTFGDSAVANETVDISSFARYMRDGAINEVIPLEIDMRARASRTLDT